MVYIDGFNLYYALRERRWQRYYWLDLQSFSRSLLTTRQELAGVRYFTARVVAEALDPQKPVRQNTYLEALGTLEDLHIHYGFFVPKTVRCYNCGETRRTFEEKMTDVNIAVEMLSDAGDDKFDTAIVVSADGDLAGPVEAIRNRYHSKRTVVAFPPEKHSARLRDAASAAFTIGRTKFRDSLLPDQVTRDDGFILTRPVRWA